MKKIFISLLFIASISSISAQTDTIYFPTVLVAAKMPNRETMLNDRSFSNNSTPVSISCPSIKFRSSNIDSTIFKSVTPHLFMNLKYPVMMMDMWVEGRIFLGFNVESNGAITNITVLKKLYKEIDSQALEAVSAIPTLKRTEKKPKNVYCILPIRYRLLDEAPNGPVTSLNQLEGDWTCVKRDLFTPMESYVSDAGVSNFRLNYGSLYFLEYPCYISGTGTIKNDSSALSNPFFKDARFRNDTLITKLPDESFTKGYRYYVRDEFDYITMSKLYADTFNLECLYGLWYLEKQRPDEIEYGPPFNITYPVYMPPIYKIDASDIYNNHTLLINVNGTKRKFKVRTFSLYEGCIELETDGWYKEPFRVKYFTVNRKYNNYGQRID